MLVSVLAGISMAAAPQDLSKRFATRDADWRFGPVIYQVLVDRFAPSANLDAKRSLYAAPRRLKPWSEVPVRGSENREIGLWSHELDFWGGDLASLVSKLDYIQSLGVDVLYLNPIHDALTNHKYDALDWNRVSPEYGTRADVAKLAKDLHGRKMRLILDGVFNHIGRNSDAFKAAQADPKSPFRDWFYIGPEFPGGYRAWANVRNLPEVNLENAAVQNHIWGSPESVVQKYLKEGADGWRLDVAYDIGKVHLAALTKAAHRAKKDSVVIGEIWNYPTGWFDSVDGLYNMFAAKIVLGFAAGEVAGGHAGRILERMVADAGIEPMLRSWMVLDSHDVPRLAEVVPNVKKRRLAQVLQFSLPGAPMVYYGTELGMVGGEDPANRAPMRWDLANDKNESLAWMKQLIRMRKSQRALCVGDYVSLDSERLLAFSRVTDKALETIYVLANGSDRPIKELVAVRDGRTTSYSEVVDLIDGSKHRVITGTLTVEVPAHSARVLAIVRPDGKGYSSYKRIG
jgi:glycosidase